MRKIFLFIIICSSLGSVFGQDTVTIYYDKDWKEIEKAEDAVFYRKAYPDKNHLWVANDYFISHKIQMTGTYKDKKMEIKQGHYVYYYENGNKKSEGNYVNDKSEGLWIFWEENGIKSSEGTYSEGYKNGSWKRFYENGKLQSDEIWKNHFRTYASSYFENGNLQYEGRLSFGKKEGEWVYGNIDGRTTMKVTYKNGIADGMATRYFREGEIKFFNEKGILKSKLGVMTRPGDLDIAGN